MVSQLVAGMGRYGYVGGHGYESGMIALSGENEGLAAVMLVHVGERWYDPGTGRFVQRDPIGLRGGLNVYGYCGGEPMIYVDPGGSLTLLGSAGLWNGLVKHLVRGQDPPETDRFYRAGCAMGKALYGVNVGMENDPDFQEQVRRQREQKRAQQRRERVHKRREADRRTDRTKRQLRPLLGGDNWVWIDWMRRRAGGYMAYH